MSKEETALVKKKVDLSVIMGQVVERKPKSKEEFFQFLGIPLQEYDLDIDPVVAERFIKSIMNIKTGLTAKVPYVCPGGVKCPVGKRCAFTQFQTDESGARIMGSDGPIIDIKRSKWPVFQPCPYEVSMITMRIQDLCQEYGVDPSNEESLTDMNIISKIAELDIYDARASDVLAREALVIKETTGYGVHEGQEIVTTKVHPAFELKEKIQKMRSELLKAMVGTRESKVKAQAALGGAKPTNAMTEIMDKFRRKLDEPIDAEIVEIK